MTGAVSHRVNPGDLGKWADRLGRSLRPTVRRGLRAAGAAAIPILQAATSKYPIHATGKFARGWRAEVEAWDRLLLRNAAPYSLYVEMGRRAGARMPPVAALMPWVRLVLAVPERRVRLVAFLVARAISRRGIPARPVLLSAQTQKRLAAAMKTELVAALREAAKGAGR